MITCIPATLRELQRLPRIPSGYVTQSVYRLSRRSEGDAVSWTLKECKLPHPLAKQYDRGDPREWLETYADGLPASELHFTVARVDARPAGIMMWRQMAWNNTIWLMDIRVREPARRSGVGSALLLDLKRACHDLGARGISLETQINNYPAISFYRKHGFEIAGFNDHLYTNRDLTDQDVALFLFWEVPGRPVSAPDGSVRYITVGD